MFKVSSEPDVYHSNVGQPLNSCLNCYPSKTTLKPSRYVNVLDFAYYGCVPWPSADGESPPFRWFADIRYTFTTPLSHHYPSIADTVLSSKQ